MGCKLSVMVAPENLLKKIQSMSPNKSKEKKTKVTLDANNTAAKKSDAYKQSIQQS